MTSQPIGDLAEIGTVVIGGGIVGLSLSWFLAAEGHDIACFDDGRLGGSVANAGSLHVQMQSRFIRLYPHLAAGVERTLPMYMRAVRLWKELAGILGADIELRETGGLMVAENAAQFDFLAAKCHRERQLGLDVEMLDRKKLDRMAPYLGPAIFGAEYCAHEGKLNPLLANDAVRRRLLDCGGSLHTEVRVTRLAREGTGFLLETTKGPVRSGRVVIAAGAGSRSLALDVGCAIPAEAEPLHMNITEPVAPLIGHLVQHAERMITLKQLAAGHVLIGGGWPARLAGEQQHPTVELSSLVGNLALAQHLVPEIGGLRLLRTWAGVNTTIDGRAVLGAIPGVPGLYVAIPGDAGYTLGPLCARLVADTISGRASEMPIDEFSPARFRARGS